MRRMAVMVASVLVLIAACEKGSESGGDVESIDLSAGSAWTYHWSVEQRSSAGELLWDTTSHFIVFVSAIGQSVGPYQNLTLLEARDRDHPSGTTEVWYSQTSDRLMEVAYRSAGSTPIILPKSVARARPVGGRQLMLSPFVEPFALRWSLNEGSPTDTIHIRDDPRVVYVFPLTAGSSWVSFTSPFREERTVSGYEDVAVPAGLFHSARIRTTLPAFAPGMEWIDFVSSQGLVKRTVDFWARVPEPGDPGGTPVVDSLRITETIVLVAH